MKKILFVTTRDPFSNNFSGDRLRASNIIKFLSKDNIVDLVFLSSKLSNSSKNKRNSGKTYEFRTNFYLKIFYSLISLIKLNPIQNGFFYSKDLESFIKINHRKYNTIIFHLTRSAQYLPSNFKGKKILEMTDLYSNNYNQTIKELSLLNPLYYIYLIELYLIKFYEKKCFRLFDKIILVSKNDVLNNKSYINLKKIVNIPNGCKVQNNYFSFNKKNNKIIFVGNIRYLPNKQACYDFAKNILPKINHIFPFVKFHIIGEISFIDKKRLKKIKNTFVHGQQKNLQKFIKNSFCAIANLKIATGMQNKILTYMSYGLPVISSLASFKGSIFFKKNIHLLVYKDNIEFLILLKKIKLNRQFSNQMSKKSFKNIKNKFDWSKILAKYKKII